MENRNLFLMEISSEEVKHLPMANNGDMMWADWEQKSIGARAENPKTLNLQILSKNQNRNK